MLARIACLRAAVIMNNGVFGCWTRVLVTDTVVWMASSWQASQCARHSLQSQSSSSESACTSGASVRQCSYWGGAFGRLWLNPALWDERVGGAAEAASNFWSLPMVCLIVASSYCRALSWSWWIEAIRFLFIKKYKHPMVKIIKEMAPSVQPRVSGW